MLKKILPLVLIILGGGAGVAAGLALKPSQEAAIPLDGENPCGVDPNTAHAAETETSHTTPARPENVAFEYVKLNNQFIIPIIRGELVKSVVVIALSLEVVEGQKDPVYSMEPKLRNMFLQALFDHASIGGFDGAFANTDNMLRLRRALREQAVALLGDRVNDVLITDIARQDN